MAITSPFNARSTALEVVEGHDLSGKVALVTGASSGIGVETVRALAQAGAETILAVRDADKGELVAQALVESTGNHRVYVLPLDLASFVSIEDMVAAFTERWNKLDMLMNNAGVMASPFEHTAEGFELQFGTNHVGHFLLTTLLLPSLLAAAPSRVVALTSIGHRRSDIIWDDVNFENRPYDPWLAYGQSKTANVLFAVGLTQRYGDQGVTANAVHPGGILTNLQRYMPMEEQRARGWIDAQGNINPMFKTPEQGAATSVWAAVGDELEGQGGLYLEDCRESDLLTSDKIVGPSVQGYLAHARNPESAERLWKLTEEMVAARS